MKRYIIRAYNIEVPDGFMSCGMSPIAGIGDACQISPSNTQMNVIYIFLHDTPVYFIIPYFNTVHGSLTRYSNFKMAVSTTMAYFLSLIWTIMALKLL